MKDLLSQEQMMSVTKSEQPPSLKSEIPEVRRNTVVQDGLYAREYNGECYEIRTTCTQGLLLRKGRIDTPTVTNEAFRYQGIGRNFDDCWSVRD